MKKFFRIFLVSALMISSFITFNNTKARAENVEPYASVAQVENHSVTVTPPFDSSAKITINYKLRRTITAYDERLTFDSYTSASVPSGYSLTVLEPMKASGSSSNMDANKYLTLNISYNVYKNGVYKGSVAVTIRYHLNTSPTVTFG